MSHAALILLAILSAPEVTTGRMTFRPTPAEAGVPESFRMAEASFSYETQPLRVTPGYTVAAVRFPSPVVTADLENNTVHAEYFRPTVAGKRPGVVVLHILGADFALSRYLAARLADRGVAALFIKLPYYGERQPRSELPGGNKRFLSTDIERSVASMRQGVLDVRRAAAWIGDRPEVDANRLGVTGISLGGIVSTLAAELDPTLNRASLMLAGGDLSEILWSMPEGEKYRKLWVDSGRSKDDLRALVAPFDPLTYADRLKSKRIIMFAGNIDEVIPPASARSLWMAAGRPLMTWFDCGHYSSAGFLLPAIRQTVDFFAVEP